MISVLSMLIQKKQQGVISLAVSKYFSSVKYPDRSSDNTFLHSNSDKMNEIIYFSHYFEVFFRSHAMLIPRFFIVCNPSESSSTFPRCMSYSDVPITGSYYKHLGNQEEKVERTEDMRGSRPTNRYHRSPAFLLNMFSLALATIPLLSMRAFMFADVSAK